MLSKNKQKYITSLKIKKFRSEEKKYLAEGKRILDEAVNAGAEIDLVIYTNQFEEKNSSWIKKLPVNLLTEIVSEKDFTKIADTNSPQGVACVVNMKQSIEPDFTGKNNFVFLENISDPGNLGTILRSCAWFGYNNIILSPDCADVYNPKVVRSSMGAVFYQDYFIDFDLPNYSFGNNKPVICTADLGRNDLAEQKISSPHILAFCNEGFGPTDELLSITDNILTIPKFGYGESLNVSAASAVILSHAAYSSNSSSSSTEK